MYTYMFSPACGPCTPRRPAGSGGTRPPRRGLRCRIAIHINICIYIYTYNDVLSYNHNTTNKHLCIYT